jgi:hypothetical protein
MLHQGSIHYPVGKLVYSIVGIMFPQGWLHGELGKIMDCWKCFSANHSPVHVNKRKSTKCIRLAHTGKGFGKPRKKLERTLGKPKSAFEMARRAGFIWSSILHWEITHLENNKNLTHSISSNNLRFISYLSIFASGVSCAYDVRLT